MIQRAHDGIGSTIGTQGKDNLVKDRSRLSQELTMLQELFEEPIDHSLTGGLSWAAPLEADERHEMKQELATGLVGAMITGDWSGYDEALDAWRATAEVLRDPDLTARLLMEDDPKREVPLRRP